MHEGALRLKEAHGSIDVIFDINDLVEADPESTKTERLVAALAVHHPNLRRIWHTVCVRGLCKRRPQLKLHYLYR